MCCYNVLAYGDLYCFIVRFVFVMLYVSLARLCVFEVLELVLEGKCVFLFLFLCVFFVFCCVLCIFVFF